MAQILIISKESSYDVYNVLQWLKYYNASCYIISPTCEIRLKKFSITNLNQEIEFFINDELINLNSFNAIWIENGTLLHPILSQIKIKERFDYSVLLFLKREWLTIREYLFNQIEKRKCLGSIKFGVVNKLIVLNIAKNLGIKIPYTEIIEYTNDNIEDFITKPISEVFDYQEEDLYIASETGKIKRSFFNLGIRRFPFLMQKNILKKFELRIFYLLGEFYSCAIFSQDNKKAKMDFRRHAETLRMVPFKLPSEIEKKLQSLMDELSLKTGSIDMIYSVNNEFVFLEVNPVGIFDNISYNNNYFLHKKIANFLINEN